MVKLPDWDELYIAATKKALHELRRRRSLEGDDPVVRLELVARLAGEIDSTSQTELMAELSWLVQHVDWYVWGRIGGIVSITSPDVYVNIGSLLRTKASLPSAEYTTLLNALLFHEHAQPDVAREVVEWALRRFPEDAYWWNKKGDLIDPASEQAEDLLLATDNSIRFQGDPNEQAEYLVKKIYRVIDVDFSAAIVALQALRNSVEDVTKPSLANRLRYQSDIAHGRILWREGDVSAAAASLLRSLQHSPQSGLQAWIGPDLELARELYTLGERAIVREYLEQCIKQFGRHADRLRMIAAQMDAGEDPSF